MAGKSTANKGFLARLMRDEAGNALVITAAATIPLIAIIGSGVDMSRAYLTRTRLQHACDAGVLAGRKVMGSTGELSSSVNGTIREYVRFNLPEGIKPAFANDSTIAPALGTNDEINLSLSTNLDTAIMYLFGKDQFTLSVNCSARNDYSNIDIVLVLDTTGSMACKPERSATNCSSWINSTGQSGKTMTVDGKTVTYVNEEKGSGNSNISRMQVLRDALASFKTQMSAIETEFKKASPDTRKRLRYAVVPFSQMVNAGMSVGPDGTTLYSRKPDWFNQNMSYKGSGNGCSGGWCTKEHSNNWVKNTWDGCVEERATINTITPSNMYSMTGSSKNLPDGAKDLQIDEAPGSTATRWTMADNNTISGQYACPRAMLEFQEMSDSAFNDYFAFDNGFVANGGTYLDLGMLWAARLISRNGLWSAENPTRYNDWPVSRFVIFMTDGNMDTGNSGYGAYRPENTYRYITSNGTAASSNNNHTARWLMTCNAIKNMDSRIFVISFSSGSELTSDMVSCSSGDGYKFKADDAAGLNDAFKSIGETIGALRLSQ